MHSIHSISSFFLPCITSKTTDFLKFKDLKWCKLCAGLNKENKKLSQQENVDESMYVGVCICVRASVDDNEKKWHGNVEWIVYNEIETLE